MTLFIPSADLPASPADKNSADTLYSSTHQTEVDTKPDRAQQDTLYVSI